MYHLVLYDGVCGLCNGAVQFILKRDKRDAFRFASLQSGVAEKVLQRHGQNAHALDTLYIVTNYDTSNEQLLSKSRGVLFILTTLSGAWSLAKVFKIFPSRWLDVVYDFVAAHRYRWFGKSETCVLPRPETRSKFLDG